MAATSLAAALVADFEQHFQIRPLAVFSPGRVTLLGKHAGHFGGLVLPVSIDRGAVVAVALQRNGRARLYSYDSDVVVDASLAAAPPAGKSWMQRLLGVAAGFQRLGIEVPGFDCMFGANLPVGAGLSAAAAVASGLAYALNELLGAGLGPMELARLALRAEADAEGAAGLTDYFTSLCSRPAHLARLDCRSLHFEYLPFDASTYRWVLCDAGVSRSRADAGYAARQEECARGLAVLRRHFPELRSLRDATPMQLHRYRGEMGEGVYRRCAFVLAENQRVELAAYHLAAGNVRAVGQQMYASHAGLRNDYAVSCPELDELVYIAQEFPAALGARMLGGLGSCTLNLVPAAEADAFVQHVQTAYARRRAGALATYQLGGGGVLTQV
ncbi:galactokinase [Hymenobacter sp. CRA2]|uniref:galactokinase n=1 Tax=Hymenobacter sp. CRA2 TaxID=1955620 RepID=UPI00098F07EE|nr:galactokinase family protein [Hymenobacter sp. CRA2]OON67058.1 hypothetical protein B0919_19695 [Hymenobacter sp. CRA2]